MHKSHDLTSTYNKVIKKSAHLIFDYSNINISEEEVYNNTLKPILNKLISRKKNYISWISLFPLNKSLQNSHYFNTFQVSYLKQEPQINRIASTKHSDFTNMVLHEK